MLQLTKWLPYVDGLVTLVVADDLGRLPMQEVLRVLAPGGAALIDSEKIVKPRPQEMDEWQQHYHNADNNAVARDELVGPPRRFHNTRRGQDTGRIVPSESAQIFHVWQSPVRQHAPRHVSMGLLPREPRVIHSQRLMTST